MRVLVTGASGLIGRRVIPRLAGNDILCLTRRPETVAAEAGVKTIRADLGDPGGWYSDIQNFAPDACIHLAWDGLPDYSLSRCRANIDHSLRLFEVLASVGVRRLVVSGSCWEYGDLTGLLCESLPPGRIGIFAAAKNALREMLSSVAQDSGITYQWARIFFVYGVGQRPQSLIPHLVSTFASGGSPLLREPEAAQDFIHVDDVADALVALLSVESQSGIVNVGTGIPTNIARVANSVAQRFGRGKPYMDRAVGSGFWADISKIQSMTNWRPRIAIDAGVEHMVSELLQAS